MNYHFPNAVAELQMQIRELLNKEIRQFAKATGATPTRITIDMGDELETAPLEVVKVPTGRQEVVRVHIGFDL